MKSGTQQSIRRLQVTQVARQTPICNWSIENYGKEPRRPDGPNLAAAGNSFWIF